MTPDGAQQRFLLDEVSGVAREDAEGFECSRGQLNGMPVAGETGVRFVELELAEAYPEGGGVLS